MADDPTAISRRSLLGGLAATAAAAALAPPQATAAPAPPPGATSPARPAPSSSGPSVAVVGAGAFGAFTALALRRLGARVTLLDAWGPGNSRASSGGETRILRGVYADRIYVELAARAFERWADFERSTGRKFFQPTGALWLVADDSDFVARAAENLRAVGFPFSRLETPAAARRFPQIAFDGVRWALWEERAGFLLARQACAAAVEALVADGGEYRLARVEPGAVAAGRMAPLRLSDGSSVAADSYVFACGPWLGALFPQVLGAKIAPTRQEVFFFGVPAGDARFEPPAMPVWIEVGERLFYGIPGNERRGFKVADDTRAAAASRHWPTRRSSRPGSASTRTPPTSTSCSTAIRKPPTPGWSAAAPATASSSLPPGASRSPRPSSAAARPSPSSPSPGCAPPFGDERMRP